MLVVVAIIVIINMLIITHYTLLVTNDYYIHILRHITYIMPLLLHTHIFAWIHYTLTHTLP
jgi:hypothetical protein